MPAAARLAAGRRSSSAQLCPAQPALQAHLPAVQLPEREQSSSVAQAWPGAKSTYY